MNILESFTEKEDDALLQSASDLHPYIQRFSNERSLCRIFSIAIAVCTGVAFVYTVAKGMEANFGVVATGLCASLVMLIWASDRDNKVKTLKLIQNLGSNSSA